MTQFDDEDLKKLERALSHVHRSRREPSLGADWTIGVMRDIRRKAAGRGRSRELPGVARLVWRTAGVAAALALVLTSSVLLYTKGDASEPSVLWASEFDAAMPFIE
jgi:hypothetical protein